MQHNMYILYNMIDTKLWHKELEAVWQPFSCDNPTRNMAELAISDDCKFGKPN